VGHLRIDLADAWNFLGDAIEDLLKPLFVLALEELHDIADVVAVDIQMPLRSGARQAARRVGIEIRQVPALQKIPEALDARMLHQGAKCRDSQLSGVRKSHR